MRTGDDLALACAPGEELAVAFAPGEVLAIAIDTLVAGVHFPADTLPADVGYKAVAVNLSDIAAMGARPAGIGLTLEMPDFQQALVRELASGVHDALAPHGIGLTDLTASRGPYRVTVQAYGWVHPSQILRRDGARAGDDIYVTGTLGDAGAGLGHTLGRFELTDGARDLALSRLNRPTARVRAGMKLGHLAHAAIDVSDGLVADLSHILHASGVGARIEVERLPLSLPLRDTLPEATLRRLALGAGDDYELCLTVPQGSRHDLAALAHELDCTATRIGTIEAQPGLRVVHADGKTFAVDDDAPSTGQPPAGGYEHFRPGS